MNFGKHFKSEDIPTAQAEFACIKDLMMLAQANIESNEFEQANERLVDIFKSIRRMEALSLKKRDEDFKQDMSNAFKERIFLQIFRRQANER